MPLLLSSREVLVEVRRQAEYLRNKTNQRRWGLRIQGRGWINRGEISPFPGRENNVVHHPTIQEDEIDSRIVLTQRGKADL